MKGINGMSGLIVWNMSHYIQVEHARLDSRRLNLSEGHNS
jgi:hypothetical protein